MNQARKVFRGEEPFFNLSMDLLMYYTENNSTKFGFIRLIFKNKQWSSS